MKKIVAILTLGLIFSLIAHTPNRVHAVGPVNPVSSLRVETTLNQDGLVTVTQQITLLSPGPLTWTLHSRTIKSFEITLDGQKLSGVDYSLKENEGKFALKTGKSGRVYQLSYLTSSNIIRHNNRDQFFFKVFQEPGTTISDIKATFHLPTHDSKSADLKGNVYAIGGTTIAQTTSESDQEVSYYLQQAGPLSLMTINSAWSKNVLQLSRIQELKLAIMNAEVAPWLVLGLVLPLFALLILAEVYRRTRRGQKRTDQIIDRPPTNLSPLIAGVLVNKKIYAEELVAMLIDLCHRGYLVIVRKGARFLIGQRKPLDDTLPSWERKILEQIFVKNNKIAQENLQTISERTLYSPKIRDAFDEIYQNITDLHFFAENPHLTRVRFKLAALILYFVSVGGIIWTTVANSSVALLIPLAATMVIAFLIIRLSTQLIRYSPTGLTTINQWQAFANYLSQDQALPSERSVVSHFEQYLSYAIVFDRTEQWAKRFEISDRALAQPDWYISYSEKNAGQFAAEIVEFTKEISQIVTTLRGPMVN